MNSTNNNQTKTKEKQSFFRSNPVLNRLNKVEERAGYNEKAAGYGRITIKTAFFLLMTVAGMMVYLVMNASIFANQPQTLAFTYKGFEVSTSVMQLGFFIGASILAIITQIISAFARPIIPVTGTIYSFCQGFLISFIVFTVIKGYEYLGLLALVITIAIVLTMGILYSAKIIKVTKKFRMIMLTLFITMVSVSILSFLGYLIPFTRPFVASILGNFWISLGLTIISIIIASLFLITDFATIDHVVTNQLPSKYEWSAAFGLAFTVLWIYVKILDLLIQIVGHGKN
ncbi:Bax inhibitor-1/YccA family membrane protein [Lachnoclostridium sp. MSJ-17]|uniref:Bax inhibitor-1/YccA family membrane protein n=1 Tax=Lachnoclostridium sp. MSJ-17 TaxID=2841516 RepID=UPI001C11F152|nr:Bax inhibitor-1/YccA family protein [Lachnoclostridium sp. MSJ-17]MBU5461721.1 Bax inhibitor-1/YccA family protein [Lachnoclostridium sp. MSJ-17]